MKGIPTRQEVEVVSKIMTLFPYGGRISTERLQHFVDHPEELTEAIFNALTMTVEKVEQMAVEHLIDCDAPPYLPEGWKVEERKKGGQLVWDKTRISLYLSEKQKNGKVISGHDLRQELKDKPVLNANVLDYLLAHPELIPEEWKGKAIFFWGTIYRRSVDSLCVRCLYWGGSRWRWGYYWLLDDWSAYSPAAVSASV